MIILISCQREILYNIASIPAAEEVEVEVRGGERGGGGASPTSDTEKELPEKLGDEEESLTWFERIRNLFPFLRHCKQLLLCVTVAAGTVKCVCVFVVEDRRRVRTNDREYNKQFKYSVRENWRTYQL